MTDFKVGQRVRVVRTSVGCEGRSGAQRMTVKKAIGKEGIIAGTRSNPNAGFRPAGDYDVSVKLDCGVLGMAPSRCLELVRDCSGMNPIHRWLVRTPQPVNGRTLHFFDCRRKQRQFATEHHGERYEVTRSKK